MGHTVTRLRRQDADCQWSVETHRGHQHRTSHHRRARRLSRRRRMGHLLEYQPRRVGLSRETYGCVLAAVSVVMYRKTDVSAGVKGVHIGGHE